MATPKNIIDRVKEEFGCELKNEKILELISSLEQRLSLEIIRQTSIFNTKINDETSLSMPYEENRITSLSINGIRLSEGIDYKTEGDTIFFREKQKGSVKIEYILLPEPFTIEDYMTRQLSLHDCYSDIYIFHILSRESLLNDDIERLNNYSALYSAALKGLISGYGKKTNERFKKIW